MRNKMEKMVVSRSSPRFRIETSQLPLLVWIIFFFFSTIRTSRAAAAAASMIQRQQQGNYSMEENNNYNLELLIIMPADRSSSRMLLNPGDAFTGNAGLPNAAAAHCGRYKPYKTCVPNPNSPKIPEHCGGVYNQNRNCHWDWLAHVHYVLVLCNCTCWSSRLLLIWLSLSASYHFCT